jgi:Ser/Thr protein kinase RdoA (MazF antagonist)
LRVICEGREATTYHLLEPPDIIEFKDISRNQVMQDEVIGSQVPKFSNEAITNVAKELYGIEGKISSLVSYEDQNARIKTQNDSYVLKIANNRFAAEALQMQVDIMAYLADAAPDLTLPRVIPSKNGENIEIVDGFLVRVFTFLEGNTLGNVARSPELYHDIGSFLGRFSTAMQGYSHPYAHKPADFWNLDNVMACNLYLDDVDGAGCRARIERFYEIYEKNTLPKSPHLRKSIIHNDVNEQNLLVAAHNPHQVSGLIDFGELQYGTHINELAITLAYALLGEDDINMAARRIIDGYTEVFLLEAEEMEVLPNLIAMRLIQSIIMTSNSAKDFPDNEYILVSQKPARKLLRRVEGGELSI